MKRSPPPWKARRASQIQSAVTDSLNLERGQGIPIGRAIKLTARKYNRRSLGDGRRLRLSRKTLERLFYAYEAAGHDPKVFELQYKPGHPEKIVDSLLARAIVSYCLTHATSIPRALKELDVLRGASISLRALYRAVPVQKIREYLSTHSRSARERARIEARNARQLARLKTEILSAV